MEHALYQAATSTFENLGYMFALDDEETAGPPAGPTVTVGVAFDGNISGKLTLEVEEALLSVVASNMLGDQGPHPTDLLYDAVGEIANVITGNALAEIAGKREVFRLGPPTVHPGPETATSNGAANVALEEGRARISIYLN